jgi:DNA processing protein
LFSYPTPFTPPTTEDDRLSWLRLIRSPKIGVATFWRLIAEHGSARAALIGLPEIARAAGVAGYEPCPEGVVLAEMKTARRLGATLLCKGDADYPADLARIADAPPALWALGDLTVMRRPMVALVGARNASSLGTRMARRLAGGLAEAGVTVVSGLARGIDAAAHAASLQAGTVAVMAGGVDLIYPPENAGLAADLVKTGVRLSEQPFGRDPQARHFPLRNRIIAGLSRAVVVVEAAHQSGSLITARLALDQGREVLAVPGHPFDGRAGGCNLLIRDGAMLVRGADDVLAALDLAPAAAGPAAAVPAGPPEPARAAARGWRDQAGLHRKILDRLGPSPLAEDQLLRDLALSASEAAPELLALELDGQIRRAPGGLLSRAV